MIGNIIKRPVVVTQSVPLLSRTTFLQLKRTSWSVIVFGCRSFCKTFESFLSCFYQIWYITLRCRQIHLKLATHDLRGKLPVAHIHSGNVHGSCRTRSVHVVTSYRCKALVREGSWERVGWRQGRIRASSWRCIYFWLLSTKLQEGWSAVQTSCISSHFLSIAALTLCIAEQAVV